MSINFKIVADSSADAINLKTDIAFQSVPLKIITDNKEFVDNADLDIESTVNYLLNYKGKTTTACPSVSDYLDAFEDAENIICITITGTLSGSYNAACIARDEYIAKYPDKNVYVINSLSAGPQLKLLIEKAIELVNNGNSFDDICSYLNNYMNYTGLTFSLECLNNLARNGRCNPIIAKAAGLLGIRIVGKASDIGDLQPLDKPRGAQKAYIKLFDRMVSEGYNGGKVRIDHCLNEEGANTLKTLIKNKFPKADVKIDITYGLCSFYAENGGMLVGFEKNM
ncbi:MAG: DegV family protein [Ruminococcus sp.]|nr:DegV family protein [Ruminococcus sp.]